ncbi:hypothetical protein D3C81_1638480 [compost metagenome]
MPMVAGAVQGMAMADATKMATAAATPIQAYQGTLGLSSTMRSTGASRPRVTAWLRWPVGSRQDTGLPNAYTYGLMPEASGGNESRLWKRIRCWL